MSVVTFNRTQKQLLLLKVTSLTSVYQRVIRVCLSVDDRYTSYVSVSVSVSVSVCLSVSVSVCVRNNELLAVM